MSSGFVDICGYFCGFNRFSLLSSGSIYKGYPPNYFLDLKKRVPWESLHNAIFVLRKKIAASKVIIRNYGERWGCTVVAVKRQVELLEKNKPRQERAKRTYEAILVAASELLIEVGVERISTNIIADRAGITVPALYRYFPNKYAVLHALGAAMMDKQNDVCVEWFAQCAGGLHGLRAPCTVGLHE